MLQVGVAAYSGTPSERLIRSCERFIEELARLCGRDTIVLVGGYWGLMKCAVDKALEKGLHVAIIAPLEREDWNYPPQAILIRTGCSSRCRSMILARSSDVLVALGGMTGTLIEILAAYTEGKPAYILEGTGLDTDRYKNTIEPHPDARAITRVEYVKTPEELAARACSLKKQ